MEYTVDNLLNLIYKKENERAATLITPKTINVQNKSGLSPLMIAVSARNKKMILHLLANGADISLKSKSGATLWQFANTQMKAFLITAIQVIKNMPVKRPFVYNSYCERVLRVVNHQVQNNSGHGRVD